MSKIETSNLTKYFGNLKAVNGISFSVDKGQITGFLGPNGAGKTTTMRIITGYLSPTAGQVKVAGLDLATDAAEVKKHIGYVPENIPLYSEMSVLGFLKFIGEVRDLKEQAFKTALARVLDALNLESVLQQRIETLSKGYKRRVALAQALLHNPEILILDEPTDGLDPNQKYEVRTLIKNLAQDKVILLSTHILEEVEKLCEHLIIISNGKLVANDSLANLKKGQNLEDVFRNLTRI